MQLIDHVSITVRDLERAKPFYRAVMAALGASPIYERDNSYLSVYRSGEATADARRHWCFRAGSENTVKAFHAAGLAAGGTDAGAPGMRAYHSGYFAAFLCDPEGNRIEAVFHRAMFREG